MKPLATNRRILTWLCVCPFDRDTSIVEKMFFIILTLFLFALVSSALVSSIVFFANNVSVDIESSLYALVEIAAYSGLLYMLMVVFILRKRINRFLGTLETIYDESELKLMWFISFRVQKLYNLFFNYALIFQGII